MGQQNFDSSVNVASLVLGIMNYQENLTQNDKSEILQNSQDVSDKVVSSIDQHLQNQDRQLKEIIELLKEIKEELLLNRIKN